MDKISCERCVYDSEDERILFWVLSQKSTENRIQAAKD